MIERCVRSIVGSDGVVDIDGNGCVIASPRSEEECALVLGAAHEERWRVRFDCGRKWMAPDAPADLAISTRLLTGITDLSPADMVLTARAGTPLAKIQKAAAAEGMWISLDPPGTNRSIGSLVATGTAGPLRAGFGAVKNCILGLTLITADGRMVRVGGRVVKNVAGFDITSLAVGSFGAFGLITAAHIRLNAVPKTDATLIATAPRDVLLAGAHSVLSSGQTPAALELFSPDTPNTDHWTLAIRLLGSDATVQTDRANISGTVSNIELEVVESEAAASIWAHASTMVTKTSTTIRLGAQPSELSRALDLMAAQLGESNTGFVAVSVFPGTVRWSCDAPAPQIQNLRLLASQQSWPVTLERAPWEVLQAVGHYGAYRDGVGRLVQSLRAVFDPRGTIVTPLGGRF